MNFPVWEITGVGGSFLIALIAILHVYVSHLAVGGGLFLWLTDRRAVASGDASLLAYVHKHTWFFLLLTMVFGGLTGVGIWFIIALVQPAATSTLIHNFVFGWAIEWVFFTGEIVALLIYHYYFERLAARTRLMIAFLYFAFAWLSLFIINGIIDFMLTPGAWLQDRTFWSGFFNPTFWPSLCFRSCIAVMCAGLFGFVTAVFLKDDTFRRTMLRYCARWLLWSFAGLVPTALWYYNSVPAATRIVTFELNPETAGYLRLLLLCSVVIFGLGLMLMLRVGRGLQKLLVAALVLVGLFWMGGFEYTREIARKPWVIYDYMYSNSILKGEEEKLNEEGILTHARWTTVREATEANAMAAGREIFNLECLSCHTIGGYNDILTRTGNFTYEGTVALLTGQGKVNSYMPPFCGTEQEKEALARYLSAIHGAAATAGEPATTRSDLPVKPATIPKTEIPAFDQARDEYILLAWNDLGMHCITDNDRWFGLLPPGNTLEAILIHRGESPEQITGGVEISYQVEDGYANPAAQVDFWQHARTVYGADLENNLGLHGKGLVGTMEYVEDRFAYVAEMIPVVPYQETSDDVIYNPYPLFTIEARDGVSGELLATTKVVAPTATEFGCRSCHGGQSRFKGQVGLSGVTARHILQVHDYLSDTKLLADAADGHPHLCQRCHADPAVGTEGDPELLSLSAAMHGWHANYLTDQGAEACQRCHPSAPERSTRCFRGVHAQLHLSCVDCHGTLHDHALALLAGEQDKPAARRLMAHLTPTQVPDPSQVNPRRPWLQEPDCLTCHEDFMQPAPQPSAFNVWNDDPSDLYRFRTGDGEVRCQACHSSTHALYPANNPFTAERDVLQPLQYTNLPYPIGADHGCAVCHVVEMEDPIHHENMDRMFRNRRLGDKSH
jgi:hypothetical protein